MQRLWVSGYRSYELNIFNDKDKKLTIVKYALKNYFKNLLEEGQLDWIITGPNLGVEQWSIEVGLELAKDYPVKIAMMAPYTEFSKRWNEHNQLMFDDLRNQVDFYATTSFSSYQSPIQLKNYQKFMFEHTDSALLVYDTDHPGKAQYDYDFIKNNQKNKVYNLHLIDFYDLEDSAQEYTEQNNRYF